MTTSTSDDNRNSGGTWSSRPTEHAQRLAELVPALPEATARDLMRLLSHSLAAPSSAEIREARLGLMLDLVADGTGEFINVERYEDAREQRRAVGETWPAHATLIAAYGDWIRVVSAAMLLMRDGTHAGVPHSEHHRRGPRPIYRRDDVLLALRRCRDDLGGWPAESEYYEWVRVSRRLARNAGQPTNRLPTRQPICKLFGDFGRALHVAIAAYADEEAA